MQSVSNSRKFFTIFFTLQQRQNIRSFLQEMINCQIFPACDGFCLDCSVAGCAQLSRVKSSRVAIFETCQNDSVSVSLTCSRHRCTLVIDCFLSVTDQSPRRLPSTELFVCCPRALSNRVMQMASRHPAIDGSGRYGRCGLDVMRSGVVGAGQDSEWRSSPWTDSH